MATVTKSRLSGSAETRLKPQTFSGWQAIMRGLIRGVRRELGRNASAKMRAGLSGFERGLAESSTNRKRKKFEEELENYLHSKAKLRRAAERHQSKQERAVRNLVRVRIILPCDRTSRRTKAWREGAAAV